MLVMSFELCLPVLAPDYSWETTGVECGSASPLLLCQTMRNAIAVSQREQQESRKSDEQQGTAVE